MEKSREKILAMIAVFCMAALGGDRLILTPLLDMWETHSQEMETLQRSISKGNLLLQRERILRKRWREMLRDALPPDVSAAENLVLKSVDRWVNNSHVNLRSLKPQWKQYEEAYTTLECRAVAEGTIEQIARFLYALEADSLPLKIESFDISASDEQGNQLTLGILFSGVQLNAKQSESNV